MHLFQYRPIKHHDQCGLSHNERTIKYPATLGLKLGKYPKKKKKLKYVYIAVILCRQMLLYSMILHWLFKLKGWM